MALLSTFAFHVKEKNTSRRAGNRFWKRLINGIVYMEFRICFTIAKYENNIFPSKYENNMFLLCEASHVFIDAFGYSKINFHQSGSFELIETMLKYLHILLGLPTVWNSYPICSHKKGAIIVYVEIKDLFCKE